MIRPFIFRFDYWSNGQKLDWVQIYHRTMRRQNRRRAVRSSSRRGKIGTVGLERERERESETRGEKRSHFASVERTQLHLPIVPSAVRDMGVVIESDRWEPKPSAFIFLSAACFASIFLRPYFSKSNAARGSGACSLLDLGPTASFLRFQRGFLLIYSLASGPWSFLPGHFLFYGYD